MTPEEFDAAVDAVVKVPARRYRTTHPRPLIHRVSWWDSGWSTEITFDGGWQVRLSTSNSIPVEQEISFTKRGSDLAAVYREAVTSFLDCLREDFEEAKRAWESLIANVSDELESLK